MGLCPATLGTRLYAGCRDSAPQSSMLCGVCCCRRRITVSYDANNPLDLVEALRDATPAQLREFSRRAALLGMSGSAIAAILAACGGGSPAPTNTPAVQATPTKGTI